MKSFDVIVVGAGAIGLAVGWRTAQLGLSVAVLDRASVGAGASGVAAGMLAPITEAAFGEERVLHLNLESARRYPAFLEELALVTGSRVQSASKGTIFVALDRDESEALRRLLEFQQSLGLDTRWLSHSELRKLEPALHPSARAGVLAEGDKDIDPRSLLKALATAVENEGGTIIAGSEVSSIVRSGVSVKGGETFSSGTVVIAAGCWSPAIAGVPAEIKRAVRPVKGQILRLLPTSRTGGSRPIDHVIRTEDVYLVPRASGGLVVGATVEEQGFDSTVTAGGVLELLTAADEVVPGIRDMELSEVSAGLRPASLDGGPLLGPTSVPGVVAATGHWRNGILLTPVTADAISVVVAKGEIPELIEAFTPGRFA